MANSSAGSRLLDWTPNLLWLFRLADERELHEHQRRRKRRKERIQQINNALIPLSTRKRALTLPLPQDPQVQETKQTTSEQLQSRFFTKLPPEIRTKIYLYVLGRDKIRILKDERSRYVQWIGQTKCLLALLRTCRCVYVSMLHKLSPYQTIWIKLTRRLVG